MTNLKSLEQQVNDYIVDGNFHKHDFFEKIQYYHEVNNLLYQKSYDFVIKKRDVYPQTKLSIKDKLKIITGFYKKLDYDIDVEELINKGIIEFSFIEDEDIKGKSYQVNEKYLIDLTETGFLIDACILVHEISHHKNAPTGQRSITNDMITEGIAYCEELLFIDYLEEIGYQSDVQVRKVGLINGIFEITDGSYSILKMFNLYSQLGSLSKDSYSMLYTDDNYEMCIEELEEKFLKKDIKLYFRMFYTFGYFIAIYLYENYLIDKNYDKIRELHTLINELSLPDLLEHIKLDSIKDNEKTIKKFMSRGE